MSESLAFYGEPLGLKMFKKHLGYYVEAAPWPETPEARRAKKAELCRLDDPREIERRLTALWDRRGAEGGVTARRVKKKRQDALAAASAFHARAAP